VWDAEGSFFPDRLYTVRFGELNSQNNENAYLYRALKANPYFKRLFRRPIYRHFYNGGALEAENVTRRFVEMQARWRVCCRAWTPMSSIPGCPAGCRPSSTPVPGRGSMPTRVRPS